jgi:predicted RNA binding protein with dsRBD fold (UPF0201 family)
VQGNNNKTKDQKMKNEKTNRAIRNREDHDFGTDGLAESVKGAFYQLNIETTEKVEQAIAVIAAGAWNSGEAVKSDKVEAHRISEAYRVAFGAGFTAEEIEFMVNEATK